MNDPDIPIEAEPPPIDSGDDAVGSKDLKDLATAVRERALYKPIAAKPPLKWRLVVGLMHGWAALLLGAGLYACASAMMSWAAGDRAVERTQTRWRVTYHGWGIALGLAAICFIASKLQSVVARRLRKRKTPPIA